MNAKDVKVVQSKAGENILLEGSNSRTTEVIPTILHSSPLSKKVKKKKTNVKKKKTNKKDKVKVTRSVRDRIRSIEKKLLRGTVKAKSGELSHTIVSGMHRIVPTTVSETKVNPSTNEASQKEDDEVRATLSALTAKVKNHSGISATRKAELQEHLSKIGHHMEQHIDENCIERIDTRPMATTIEVGKQFEEIPTNNEKNKENSMYNKIRKHSFKDDLMDLKSAERVLKDEYRRARLLLNDEEMDFVDGIFHYIFQKLFHKCCVLFLALLIVSVTALVITTYGLRQFMANGNELWTVAEHAWPHIPHELVLVGSADFDIGDDGLLTKRDDLSHVEEMTVTTMKHEVFTFVKQGMMYSQGNQNSQNTRKLTMYTRNSMRIEITATTSTLFREDGTSEVILTPDVEETNRRRMELLNDPKRNLDSRCNTFNQGYQNGINISCFHTYEEIIHLNGHSIIECDTIHRRLVVDSDDRALSYAKLNLAANHAGDKNSVRHYVTWQHSV